MTVGTMVGRPPWPRPASLVVFGHCGRGVNVIELPPGVDSGPMETTDPAATNAVTGITGRERVRASDLAAGLAVFFISLVHVLWHWGAPETWTTPIGEEVS